MLVVLLLMRNTRASERRIGTPDLRQKFLEKCPTKLQFCITSSRGCLPNTFYYSTSLISCSIVRNSVLEGRNEILSRHCYSFALYVFISCPAEQEVSTGLPVALGAGRSRANHL